MRTKDAVSNHTALTMSISLGIFIVLYFCVFGIGILYLLKLIAKGPQIETDSQGTEYLQSPARPLSAAPNADPLDFNHKQE